MNDRPSSPGKRARPSPPTAARRRCPPPRASGFMRACPTTPRGPVRLGSGSAWERSLRRCCFGVRSESVMRCARALTAHRELWHRCRRHRIRARRRRSSRSHPSIKAIVAPDVPRPRRPRCPPRRWNPSTPRTRSLRLKPKPRRPQRLPRPLDIGPSQPRERRSQPHNQSHAQLRPRERRAAWERRTASSPKLGNTSGPTSTAKHGKRWTPTHPSFPRASSPLSGARCWSSSDAYSTPTPHPERPMPTRRRDEAPFSPRFAPPVTKKNRPSSDGPGDRWTPTRHDLSLH